MTTQEPLGDRVRRIIADEMGGLTPEEWARLFKASRAGLVARMTGEGMGPERAEQLVDAWDNEAERRGLSRLSTAYWDQAPDWIRQQRAEGRPTTSR